MLLGINRLVNFSEQQAGFFFSTSLPLTSTRWVRTTIKLCTVHSLSSTLSLNLIKATSRNSEKILGTLRIEPGPAGCEARMLPLRYADPPKSIVTCILLNELYALAYSYISYFCSYISLLYTVDYGCA